MPLQKTRRCSGTVSAYDAETTAELMVWTLSCKDSSVELISESWLYWAYAIIWFM